MSHQSPGELGRGRNRDFPLCVEALAILLNSSANTWTEKNKRERERENRYREEQRERITFFLKEEKVKKYSQAPMLCLYIKIISSQCVNGESVTYVYSNSMLQYM